MRRAVLLVSLVFFISGCGDLAPTDSVVTGPADSTTTLNRSTEATNVIYSPLDFTVSSPEGDPRPQVQIEFFRGGDAFLSDVDGNLLSNSSQVKNTTDDRGLGRVSAVVNVPGCVGTTNVVAQGSVLATVGSASALWKVNITRTCATTTTTPAPAP